MAAVDLGQASRHQTPQLDFLISDSPAEVDFGESDAQLAATSAQFQEGGLSQKISLDVHVLEGRGDEDTDLAICNGWVRQRSPPDLAHLMTCFIVWRHLIRMNEVKRRIQLSRQPPLLFRDFPSLLLLEMCLKVNGKFPGSQVFWRCSAP
jgi:hypothetical protein